MATNSSKDSSGPGVLSRASSRQSGLSLQSPRTPRFAEATSIISPIEPRKKIPFPQPLTTHFAPQSQPADLYPNEKHVSVEMENTDIEPLPYGLHTGVPLMSPPLKSALKTPGTARPQIFSPTFKEEETLEKHEADTEKEQVKDLRIKTRVRMAKFFLRGVNFSCSLIVLSMLSATFTIFNATKSLPPRLVNSNKFPPWAIGQKTWPQITVLVIACVSLVMCVGIFWSYTRGGHRRAEKLAIYYTTFAVAAFVFSTIMWILGAVVLQSSKANGNAQDMWGWSCKQNTRSDLFQKEVNYALVCRLQNWSLVCCIIEVVVELATIAVYGIVFYRYFSKRRLRKSMANRDKARSDLYLAQLRSQSAPNTPGLNPYTTSRGDLKEHYAVSSYEAASSVEQGRSHFDDSTRYVDPERKTSQPKPFVLQTPPIKIQTATPKMQQTGFTPISLSGDRSPSPPSRGYTPPTRTYSPPSRSYSPVSPIDQQQQHLGVAPGEQVYDAVPIPGAYAHPSSPVNGGFPRP